MKFYFPREKQINLIFVENLMYETKTECYLCVHKFGKNLKNADKSKGSFLLHR